MIPSIEFNITEGLAHKFASMLKYQRMLAASASNLVSLHASHETLSDNPIPLPGLAAWDKESLEAIRTKCWENFHRSKHLLAAIIPAVESMLVYLRQFRISVESVHHLEQELSAIKPNRDVLLLRQAELILYLGMCYLCLL